MPDARAFAVRAWLVAALVAAGLVGCAGPTGAASDPLAELSVVPGHPRRQLEAIAALDLAPPAADASEEASSRRSDSLAALHRLMYAPYYTVTVREAAFHRLAAEDQPNLKRTIRQRLPRMPISMHEWRARLCGLVADAGWIELSPGLVSSWARPVPGIPDDERAEFLALARLHGRERVPDVVFEMFVESSRVAERGLRKRCWDLLHRLGDRDRLIELLHAVEPAADDGMLVDLRAGAVELGIVPHNGQEIDWLRTLREPARAEFWSQAVAATQLVEPRRRTALELRDLPVIVSAMLHDPAALSRTEAELYAALEQAVRGQSHYGRGTAYFDGGSIPQDRLHHQRKRLTWSDLLALRMAARALAEPAVVAHLHDYSLRDRADRSTEYGGVIRLDRQGRFEVVEFPPRIRQHDNKFIATQAMFDAGATALFHFHYHVQRERNVNYAGPGPGDLDYANLNRTNCLVLTSVGGDRLNVDFYRHSGMVVDLGVIAPSP